MKVHIEMGSLPLSGRLRTVHYYAYAEEEGNSVRDANLAKHMIDRMCGPKERRDGTTEDSPIERGNPRELGLDGYKALFDISISVTNTHRDHASYSADYRRLDPACDSKVSEQGMVVFREVKRVMREAIRYWEQEKARRREAVKARLDAEERSDKSE